MKRQLLPRRSLKWFPARHARRLLHRTLTISNAALDIRSKRRAYFLQALTHRSYLQFAQYPTLKSNERLEFLGDSILNLVIAEYLYGEFESLPEGDLTKLRSRLVSGSALVQHAMENQSPAISSALFPLPTPRSSAVLLRCSPMPMKRLLQRSIWMAE